MPDTVLYEVDAGIATVVLNRPAKLNAINYELADRRLSLLDELEVDPEAQAIVLTGAGDRAFSAGGDIHEFAESVKKGANYAIRDFVRRGQNMTNRLESFSKPIIAAVNGIAFGGGCEITEAVHLAIASETAIFAKPEINLGMPPTFGGTQRLTRAAGRKRALELLLTAERFSPGRAMELGLINAVFPHEELLSAARSLAQQIVRHSPLAVTSIINAVTRGINLSIGEGLLVESEQFARMVPSHDLGEGLDAWVARRPAVYTGQ